LIGSILFEQGQLGSINRDLLSSFLLLLLLVLSNLPLNLFFGQDFFLLRVIFLYALLRAMTGLICCRGWPLPNHLIASVPQPPQPLPGPLWDLLGHLELARHGNRYLMPLLHLLLLPLLIAGPLLPICYLDLIPAYLGCRQLPLLLLLSSLLRLPLPSSRRLLCIPSLLLILETLNRIESLLLFLL
jgi:hypothetical protein